MQLKTTTERYTKQFKRWLESLLIEKKPSPSSKRYCLTLYEKTLSFIEVDMANQTPTVLTAEARHVNDFESIPFLIDNFINRESLDRIPAYWLLPPEDYQLFLIESLPVQDDEIQNALTWRLKSLLNYPMEEAVIDYFKIPSKRASNDHMIAAIAARRKPITMMVDIFKQSGLSLSTIDIPELAMRNLSALYENDEKSTAFIYFYPGIAILNITRQKTLYFTRRIALPNEDNKTMYDLLSLELIRYFDYYQSQWRHPSPSRIFIAAESKDTTQIASQLSECLLTAVIPYQLIGVKGETTLLHSLNKRNLLTLGCALRKEEADAKTRR